MWFFGRENYTSHLLDTFRKCAAEAESSADALDDLINNLTAENCPLSPCDGCHITGCKLRLKKLSDEKNPALFRRGASLGR